VGQGAGSLPTAHAAVQDLLDLAEGKKEIVQSAEPGQLTDEEEQTFYLRTNRADFFQDVVAERISEKAFLTKKLTLAEISSLVKESGDPSSFLAGVADE
jgi:homoserine dehydrogenase